MHSQIPSNTTEGVRHSRTPRLLDSLRRTCHAYDTPPDTPFVRSPLMLARLLGSSSLLSHRFMSVAAHPIAAVFPGIEDCSGSLFTYSENANASWPAWQYGSMQSHVCKHYLATGGVRTSSGSFRTAPRHHGHQHCASTTRGSHPDSLTSTRESGQLAPEEVIPDLPRQPPFLSHLNSGLGDKTNREPEWLVPQNGTRSDTLGHSRDTSVLFECKGRS